MSNKARGVILKALSELQKSIQFDECNFNKTFYDGVKHGIRISKKVIDSIPEKELAGESDELGSWVKHGRGRDAWFSCPECGTVASPVWKRCPLCEKKMMPARYEKV